MSKSLGNVIDPVELVDKYGADSVRYFMLRELPPTEDGDFSFEKFEERYNADLAKGIGNLAARVTTIAKKINASMSAETALNPEVKAEIDTAQNAIGLLLKNYKFNEALSAIWRVINFGDKYIEKTQPWKTKDTAAVGDLLFTLSQIGQMLGPFIPQTSAKIKKLLAGEDTSILFPRLDTEKKN
jgi:Methionyl-tRNA synthetase